jgi:hypothetical protein
VMDPHWLDHEVLSTFVEATTNNCLRLIC